MLAELSIQKYWGCSVKVAVVFLLFQRGKEGFSFCLCVYLEKTALSAAGGQRRS